MSSIRFLTISCATSYKPNEMKRTDLFFLGILAAIFLPFMLSSSLYECYNLVNQQHGLLLSFIKFAILATLGESLGLRIRQGIYSYPGFGFLPRAVVWGFLGLAIKIAFIVFSQGSTAVLGYFGWLSDSSLSYKVMQAFTASALMNLIFAPVMMTFHKITDTHIIEKGGTLSSLVSPINFGSILQKTDWNVMWNFVFKKTIPLFWIPAHTITFLLPPSFQVLFAALLGIVLGVILAFAANKGK